MSGKSVMVKAVGVWEAFVLYDPTTQQRIGIYVSQREMVDDCPGWADEGYILAPCEIVIVKAHTGGGR